MTALEIISEKKRRGELLPASETVIWEACWQGINNRDVRQMKLAETAANELAAKDARIAELGNQKLRIFKAFACANAALINHPLGDNRSDVDIEEANALIQFMTGGTS